MGLLVVGICMLNHSLYIRLYRGQQFTMQVEIPFQLWENLLAREKESKYVDQVRSLLKNLPVWTWGCIFQEVPHNRHPSFIELSFADSIFGEYYSMRFLPLDQSHLSTLFQFIEILYNFLLMNSCTGEASILSDLKGAMFSDLWPTCLCCCTIC